MTLSGLTTRSRSTARPPCGSRRTDAFGFGPAPPATRSGRSGGRASTLSAVTPEVVSGDRRYEHAL